MIYHCRELVESLSTALEELRAEYKQSFQVQSKQEEVIAALKEETKLLDKSEAELRDVKKKYGELMTEYEELKTKINQLNKV
jgi:chromosome segregation ATPase